MKQTEEKTNVMRILEQRRIPYVQHCYLASGAINGMEVAEALDQDPRRVFKTLVTVGRSGVNYVFLVPVCTELSLKLASCCVKEKKLEMLRSKELLPLTGYIHGGCSPIGMKKQFRTVIDKSAADFPTIFFSAGKIGYQVELSLSELKKALPFELHEISLS